MEITLLFPHQLFKANPATTTGRRVYLFEDPLFFTQLRFHKSKLILHRASMKYASSFMEQQGYDVRYVSCLDIPGLDELFLHFTKMGVTHIHSIEPSDYLLSRRLNRHTKKHAIEISFYNNPMFLLTLDAVKSKLGARRSYLMANFYKKQRTDLDILIDNGDPAGGKWSFDKDNRKKLPQGSNPPDMYFPRDNKYTREAKEYVRKNFADNPGNADEFIFPVTYYQAERWLEDFLENRMPKFGDYEDAISQQNDFLYHSVLSPALNIGLLTPVQVLDKTFEAHRKKEYPMNCLEGFVRQIIGWREFIRGIYECEGVFQRTENHFRYTRRIPRSFWDGTTGIPPVDDTINKIMRTGYAHHIERLMVLGNFMLLCEFDPNEVYSWFMELFIDAYDWVMVPNVYGMIMYADGGLFTTKPYISGSNYIRKMSHYKKGEWCDIWDGLYWRFLNHHQEELMKNHRMNMVMSLLDRMDKSTLEQHVKNGEEYLSSL